MIIDYLKKGRENAITLNELCSLTGMTKRMVSKHIRDARTEKNPICADSTGYWISDKPEELYMTCKRMRSRMNSERKTHDALKDLADMMRSADNTEQVCIDDVMKNSLL